jgi:hypothetical protein
MGHLHQLRAGHAVVGNRGYHQAVYEEGYLEALDDGVEGEHAAVEGHELERRHQQRGPAHAEADLEVEAVAVAAQTLF